MLFPTTDELEVLGVFDRGVPNQERITIRPTRAGVNLGQFCVLIGALLPDNTIQPIRDQLFWFGEGIVSPPEWIFIYTGPGNNRKAQTDQTKEPAYVLHWGKKTTVLQDPRTTPILIRIDGVSYKVHPSLIPGPPKLQGG